MTLENPRASWPTFVLSGRRPYGNDGRYDAPLFRNIDDERVYEGLQDDLDDRRELAAVVHAQV